VVCTCAFHIAYLLGTTYIFSLKFQIVQLSFSERIFYLVKVKLKCHVNPMIIENI